MTRQKKKPRPRHREGTEQRLLDAVGEVLSRDGASALTPTAVAREAGANKALIYRYFSSFEGLIGAYASSRAYWPTVEEVFPDIEALKRLPFPDRFAMFVRNYAAALRSRPATVSLLAAELVDPGAIDPRLLARREQFGLALLELAQDAPRSIDLAALASLITGSIHYLLVRARQVDSFNGIAINTDEGWARLEAAVEQLAHRAAQP